MGDRVLSLAGHGDVAFASELNMVKVPDGLEDEQALFGILGSIALHGMRAVNPQYGENVLVLGLGVIGQIAVQLARLSGVERVVGADLYPLRMETAEKGGADSVLDVSSDGFVERAMDLTSGKGYDIVVEASGNPQSIVNALKLAANRGRILILGCPHGKIDLDLYNELQRREISLIGSYQPNCPTVETPFYPWTQNRNRELILRYLDKGRLDFSPLVTHKSSCEDAPELYSTLSKEKDKAIAAIMEWNLEGD